MFDKSSAAHTMFDKSSAGRWVEAGGMYNDSVMLATGCVMDAVYCYYCCHVQVKLFWGPLDCSFGHTKRRTSK
eukprot:9495157-Pyramimonas_sp.AAC.2